MLGGYDPDGVDVFESGRQAAPTPAALLLWLVARIMSFWLLSCHLAAKTSMWDALDALTNINRIRKKRYPMTDYRSNCFVYLYQMEALWS